MSRKRRASRYGAGPLIVAIGVGLLFLALLRSALAAASVADARQAPGLVVVFDPPELLPCGARGWSLLLPNGAILPVVRMTYLPSSIGLAAVPQAPGRVFCDGFEVRA